MSFEDRETSRAEGAPISLYLFRYGTLPNSWYAYTNSIREIQHTETFDGDDYEILYEPIAITHDKIQATGNLDKATLQITAERGISMRELFVGYPPSSVTVLTIRQGHIGETEYPIAWVGAVRSFERDGDEVQMSGESAHSSLRRPGFRKHYQITCPHQFTGPDCRKERATVLSTGTVLGISNFDVTLNPGWDIFDTARYPQGEMRWTGEDGETVIRQIMRIPTTDTLRLGGPASDLEIGATVEITPGCFHRISDCDFWVNTPNYGGDNWIPKRTPFGFRNNFY